MYQNIINAADNARELIIEAEKHIWNNPETGYREWNTTKYLSDKFISLGYTLTFPENIPGFFTTVDTGRDGPAVLILAELDSLICADHPDANPETHAVHCCGHHAQCAALLGIASALKNEDVLSQLSGKIKLCCVPAEEVIELDYRKELKDKGIIKYFSGKAEFIYRGYFDDVDMAFMVHTFVGDNCFRIVRAADGILAKEITFKGKSSHAGSAPQNGINALYAANLAINAVNSLRETFMEKDYIRFHPIITKGGDAVNAIPSEVKMSTFVRAASFEAMLNTNKKVNRALAGAAAAIGAKVNVFDISSSAPLVNDENLAQLYKECALTLCPTAEFRYEDIIATGSTDMGDLSRIMPAIHPYISGASGTMHGADYKIFDTEQACVNSAKVQLILLHKLLSDGAKNAYEVIENKSENIMTRKEYFEMLDRFDYEGELVEYEDDKITIKI